MRRITNQQKSGPESRKGEVKKYGALELKRNDWKVGFLVWRNVVDRQRSIDQEFWIGTRIYLPNLPSSLFFSSALKYLPNFS